MKMSLLPLCWCLSQRLTLRMCHSFQYRNLVGPYAAAYSGTGRTKPSHHMLCTQHVVREFCSTRSLSCSKESNQGVINDDDVKDDYLHAKIKAVTEDIVSRISVKYDDHDSMAKQEISAKLQLFIDHGLPFQSLDKIGEVPEILHRPEQFIALLKTLTDLGMMKKGLAKMISNDPAVIHFQKATVTEAFYKLLNIGFTSDLIVSMFINQPQIITVNLDGVAKRIEELKLLFNTKHTFSLVTNNPGLLFTDLEEVRRKFMYIYNEMGVTQPQMMHTQIFNHSLEHIHTRHMFAVRTGFFKIVKEKDKFRNPKLDVILDTSDAAFAKKFGNMSVREYRCFQALLLKEELLYGGKRGTKVEDHDNESVGDYDEDVDYLKEDNYQYT